MTDIELEALLKATEGHTAGPWLAERHGMVTAVVGKQRRQVASTTGDAVMHDDPSTSVIEFQMTNARLIAAAPTLRAEVVRLRAERDEMLELLRDLRNAHEGAVNVSDDPFPDDLDRSHEWLARINVAIAKAEVKP